MALRRGVEPLPASPDSSLTAKRMPSAMLVPPFGPLRSTWSRAWKANLKLLVRGCSRKASGVAGLARKVWFPLWPVPGK